MSFMNNYQLNKKGFTPHLFASKRCKGFTLVELLIVIAIIAIIAAVVFVALDPLTRFRDARDSTRWQDVSAMVEGIIVDQVDNGGTYITALSSSSSGTYQLGTAGSGCDSGCTATTTLAACLDLSGLASEGYVPSIPLDPNTGTAAETDYYLYKSDAGFITVGACDPEGTGAISITR
jgi:prepilin-type N-terminal cleavage/methylation domain-containing protein